VTKPEKTAKRSKTDKIVPFSEHPAAVTRKKLQANPRVDRIRIIVPENACPACRKLEGEHEKDIVPELPTLSCSHPDGCCSYYEPTLNEIIP